MTKHARPRKMMSGPASSLPSASQKTQPVDWLAAVQRIDDALEDRVDDDFRMLLREVRNPRDFLDELRFRHAASIHRSLPLVAPRRCWVLRAWRWVPGAAFDQARYSRAPRALRA